MAKVIIDGREFECGAIDIRKGAVTIDGKVLEGRLMGVVEIRIIEGVLWQLSSDCSVTCGEVQGDVDAGGSVQCSTVSGCVDAGGSVMCGNVGGNVDAGGGVTCGAVSGNVDAGGSIKIVKDIAED